VLIQHEEDPMNKTLAALDREWAELDRSPATGEAVGRWAHEEPALAGLPTLGAILTARTDPGAAQAILAALARLAVDDDLAARTLLQALVPGLVRLASRACADDPLALDELISLAWERIRTYPTRRPGSVAANVLWDVRKRYRKHRLVEVPAGFAAPASDETSPSAEEIVLGRCVVEEIVAAQRSGVISVAALRLILRTRLHDVPLGTAAADHHATSAQANCIRWRAERRLRLVLAMAS
jgi:hypothetical protein